LEVDRREIRHRISTIKGQLEKVRENRMRSRAQRKRSHIPIVALVGYTNAGKSTLLNKLANTEVYVADQLFATLDPTTRRVELPGGHWALFTDTIGFIQKLPTQLVAAFRATLEEIAEADLLIHVVDITHPQVMAQAKAVLQTLEEIDASHIPQMTALNKLDRLKDPESARHALRDFPESAAISAMTGQGLPELLKMIEAELFETYIPVTVRLPYLQGQLISLFHDQGQIQRVENERGGVLIQGNLPVRLLARYQQFLKNPPGDPQV
jgi:GTP-binding protein HflX